MLYTKIQSRSFRSTGEEDFKCFYHIWAWKPSCSMMHNHLNRVSNPFDRRPNVKSGENWSSGFRKKDV